MVAKKNGRLVALSKICSGNSKIAIAVFFVLAGLPAMMANAQSTIQLIGGKSLSAEIKSVDLEGLVSGDTIPEGLSIQEVLSYTTGRKSVPVTSNPVSLFLNGGGLLKITSPNIANEKVTFKSDAGAAELSLESVRAIVWKTSLLVESTLQEPSSEFDTVIVETSNGDRSVSGILEAIDEEFLHVNYKGESRKIGLPKIKAVIAADLGLTPPRGAIATLQLVDGGQATGLIREIADGEIEIVIPGGSSLRFKMSNVVRFSITSDRLLYLSDSSPIDVEEKAVFTVQRNWKRDRSVMNNPLRIRVPGNDQPAQYAKGLGVQAASRLVFANTNEFDRFSAVVGIDAETKGRGDCKMVVRGDGIELWSSRVRGSDKPQEINVNIAGMREVELTVYPGKDFDLGDHADWANARFLKTN
ncbi:MAG: hypothetical protein ACI87E_004394 [Mariniblastus sp.]|jgi:hypothetical protein